MSRTQRVTILVVAAVIAIAAFVVLRPSDEEDDDAGRGTPTAQPAETAPDTDGREPPATTPESTPEARPREPEIQLVRVSGGRPVGGVQTIEAKSGETVRFRVQTETPQEIHLHGYDLTENTSGSGRPAEFRFKADETGIFELEVHGTHTQIAELKVEP